MNKIVLGLVWFVIPLLVLASFLLFSELLNNNVRGIGKQLIVVFGIILILTFAFILTILSTKYRKEMLLSDDERRKKWKFLRKDFRDFHKKMIVFTAALFVLIIITGIFLLFNSNSGKWSGIFFIIIGFSLLSNIIRSIKELREMEALKKKK